MRRNANPLTALLITATTLIGLGACSSDSKLSSSTTESSASTTSATTTEATTETTTADSSAGPDTQDEAQLQAALLTPAEIGPTYQLGTFTPPSGTGTPCGVDVDAQVPSSALAGVQIVQPDPLMALIEEIRAYDSVDHAKAAYELAVSGFSCGGTEDLKLGEPTDVSSDLGTAAVGFSVAGGGYEGGIFLVLVRDSIVVFQFQATEGADTSAAPAPLNIVTAGLAKIDDSFGG